MSTQRISSPTDSFLAITLNTQAFPAIEGVATKSLTQPSQFDLKISPVTTIERYSEYMFITPTVSATHSSMATKAVVMQQTPSSANLQNSMAITTALNTLQLLSSSFMLQQNTSKTTDYHSPKPDYMTLSASNKAQRSHVQSNTVLTQNSGLNQQGSTLNIPFTTNRQNDISTLSASSYTPINIQTNIASSIIPAKSDPQISIQPSSLAAQGAKCQGKNLGQQSYAGLFVLKRERTKRLDGIIMYFVVESFMQCALRCQRNSQCKGITVEYDNLNLALRDCYLHKGDDVSHLELADLYDYYEKLINLV